MSNLIARAKEQLEERVKQALVCLLTEHHQEGREAPRFLIEIPAQTSHGDFSCNVAMVSSKLFRLPPREIAAALLERMTLEGSYFERAEVAGPGFLNFFISQRWFSDVVADIVAEKEQYGRCDVGSGKRVIVEFVSANPTGPMHIGNARGGALGDGLASVLSFAGYEVYREFYVNDAGNQINKFGRSLSCRYLQLYDPTLAMPEEAYLGEDIISHAKNFQALHGDRYRDCSEQERQAALVAFALPQNIEAMKADLRQYRIEYDNWFLESSLHGSAALADIMQKLRESGYTYEQEGALWLAGTKLGADQDFVLIRQNGVPTYVVPDIAYHYNKLVTRGFDRAINVLGADHHGYMPRLKAALRALSVDDTRLEAVLMQMVRLVRDGEVIKASKRSGKAITLVSLLDEVPIDAARLLFNLREANTQMDFDLDLAVEQSSENPVYYLQYAHARICSILSKLAAEQITVTAASDADLTLLDTTEDRELIRILAKFPGEIAGAAEDLDPSRVTKYLLGVAAVFHKFYNVCPVNSPDVARTKARLLLCHAAKTVLHNALTLLNISAPERM